MSRLIYEQEHEDFRDAVRHLPRARRSSRTTTSGRRTASSSREVWRKAGEQGLLCFDVDEEYGGAGIDDFRYNMVIAEEMARRRR